MGLPAVDHYERSRLSGGIELAQLGGATAVESTTKETTMSQSFADELSGVKKSHNLAVSLERAYDYARDGGQPTVTLEHLLLALSEDSEAVGVLSACNVDLDRLRTDVAGFLGRSNGQVTGGDPIADPELVKIIRHASAAAQKSGRPELHGAIVLAAIVGDGKSNAAQMLEGQGLTFQGTLQALQTIGNAGAAKPADQPQTASAPRKTEVAEPDTQVPVAASPVRSAVVKTQSEPEQVKQQSSAPVAASSEASPSADTPPAAVQPSPSIAQEPSMDDILASVRGRIDARNTEVQKPDADGREELRKREADPVQQTWPPEPAPGALPTAQPRVDRPEANPVAPQPEAPRQQDAHRVPVSPAAHHPGLVQPSASSELTDKWARAIDGKPAASAAPATAQQPEAEKPVDGVNPAAQAAPQIASRPAPISGKPPTTQQPDPKTLPGVTSKPAPGSMFGTAPDQGVPKSVPVSAAPDSAGGLPIEPWPEPRDPTRQPPPSPAPVPGNSDAANYTTNPAGAPYPPQEEVGAAMQRGPSRQNRRTRQQRPPAQGRQATAAGGQSARKRANESLVSLGQLVENIPRIMRVDIPATVEVRIARDKVETLSDGMTGQAPVQRHDLFITKAMTVKLKAPDGGFWIETASPETQWIENALGLLHDEFASWRWTVTPQLRGAKRLQLVVSARTVGTDGLAAETPMPDQIFTVKVRVNYKKAFKKFGGWVLAALVGGAISTVGGSVIAGNGLKGFLAMIGL